MSIDAPVPVEGKAPRKFMWMPAGKHTINARRGGQELTITVEVDRETAVVAQQSLEAWQAKDPRKPFLDFDHERKEASAWPERFSWQDAPAPGVYVEASWSEAGERAIVGRGYRGFSPEFFPDRDEGTSVAPARVAFLPLTMGGLTNKPAFHENRPLWASEVEPAKAGTTNNISAAKAAVAVNESTKEKNMPEENKTAAAEKGAQETIQAKETEILDLKSKLAEADKAIKAQRTKDASLAVQAAVKRGALPAKATELHGKWQKWCEESPEMIEALEKIPGTDAVEAHDLTAGKPRIEGGFSAQGALKEYSAIISRNTRKIGPGQRFSIQTAEEMQSHAVEAANFYKRELAPKFEEFSDIPIRSIMAATDADSLGTLAGVLVLQQSLPLFRYQFPVLSRLYSDFSATPGLYNQTENTRVIVVPAVQTYDPTVGSDGRPKGWQTVVAAQTTDAPVKLDTYVGVPIVFGQATISATIRRLFDEQGPAAIYAMAKYFVNKVTALMTLGNFNAYAAVKAGVPDSYASYVVAQKDFSMNALDDLEAIFDANEVPETDRGVLLCAKYHGQLRKDPRLGLFFAAMQKPDMITEGRLPKLNGFLPERAPWLPSTGNMTGFAFHKAAIVLKQRLPTDFTEALNVMVPGSVTTVTDPTSGLSCLLVQYISLQGNYAEWRVEALLGAAVGDKRGGLVITSV